MKKNKKISRRRLSATTGVLLLSISSVSVSVDADEKLSIDNLNDIYFNKTMTYTHFKGDEWSGKSFYSEDGTYYRKRNNGDTAKGSWYIDENKKKRCVKFKKKESCRDTRKNDDGTYSVMKGSKEIVRITKIQEGDHL